MRTIIRARHRGRRRIYVHNDFSNAAAYFLGVIESKTDTRNLDGIAFDRLACLVMLAFAFEAKINFLGHKLIPDWDERHPFNKKVDAVFERLRITPRWSDRPYASIARLKDFRDGVAHGKPIELEFDETIDMPEDQIDRRINLDGPWVAHCDAGVVFDTYADISAVWHELLDQSGLRPAETISHGVSGLTFLERIEEDGVGADLT